MNGPIFVFGSNLAGRHGKGAAKYAKDRYGAVDGIGTGPTGRAYALPTKDVHLRPLPIQTIDIHVNVFCDYARNHPDYLFLLTPVGTGLAGHPKRAIWGLLIKHRIPENVALTSSWINGGNIR